MTYLECVTTKITMNIYTDGNVLLNKGQSKDPLAIGCFGFWCHSKTFLSNCQWEVSSTTMEIKAVISALEYIITDKIYRATIYSDSQSVVHLLNNKTKKPKSYEGIQLFDLFASINNKTNLKPKIVWVKGHFESEGNLKIDQLLEEQLIRCIKKLDVNTQLKIIQKAKSNLSRGITQSFSEQFFDSLFKGNF